MYEILSKYYDGLMTDFDYDAYEAFLAGKLTGLTDGYDMACGSGEMTVRLKKRGFDVAGCDVSPEMLEKAVGKAHRQRLNIPFFVCDLNNIGTVKKRDFVTAVCDGFNYVRPNNLSKVFSTIYALLNDGGVFVFDISSEHKLKHVLGNNLFFEDNENLTYFWQNSLKGDKVKMELTFFEKQGDLYKRSDEEETQYVHKTSEIAAALKGAGFKTELFNEKFKKFNESDNRLVAVAKK